MNINTYTVASFVVVVHATLRHCCLREYSSTFYKSFISVTQLSRRGRALQNPHMQNPGRGSWESFVSKWNLQNIFNIFTCHVTKWYKIRVETAFVTSDGFLTWNASQSSIHNYKYPLQKIASTPNWRRIGIFLGLPKIISCARSSEFPVRGIVSTIYRTNSLIRKLVYRRKYYESNQEILWRRMLPLGLVQNVSMCQILLCHCW